MVDINIEPLPSGWVHPLDYLDTHFPGDTLHRFVQAHADVDHMHGLHELLSRRQVRYVWLPADSQSVPRGGTAAERLEWASYDRLCRGKVAGVQPLSPVLDDRGGLDMYWLEGWSVVMPTRGLAEISRAAAGVAPPSYMLAMEYAGVRVLLVGEVRRSMWPSAIRDRAAQLRCTILRASHPVRDEEADYNARPYGPALDLMRPAHLVLSADLRCEAEVLRAYRDRGVDVLSSDRSKVVILRIDPAGTLAFESEAAA